jgi:hypothetical protein
MSKIVFTWSEDNNSYLCVKTLVRVDHIVSIIERSHGRVVLGLVNGTKCVCQGTLESWLSLLSEAGLAVVNLGGSHGEP